jgi:hypothetical protein
MVKKKFIIYQCYVNLLSRHPRCRHHCSSRHCRCPIFCLPWSSPSPSSSLLPSLLPLLACHPRCCHHCPLCCCCSPFTCNPCFHCHCLVALSLFLARHSHCRCHHSCSPCPFPLRHPPASLLLPSLLPSPLPSPATLDAVAIALAIIAIALFVACHSHRRGHHPLGRCCRCLPATLVAIAIALFASAAIHGDCHCAVAAILPSIVPPPLTATRIVLLLLLSPIVTPAIVHCRHSCPSPPLLPIVIVLPSRHPLRIRRCCILQSCCYLARCPPTCRLVVTLDWLSLRHLHADGVMVSHLFPAVDISVWPCLLPRPSSLVSSSPKWRQRWHQRQRPWQWQMRHITARPPPRRPILIQGRVRAMRARMAVVVVVGIGKDAIVAAAINRCHS